MCPARRLRGNVGGRASDVTIEGQVYDFGPDGTSPGDRVQGSFHGRPNGEVDGELVLVGAGGSLVFRN